MFKLGFIGAGNMAGAIYAGLRKNNVYQAGEIALCDNDQEKLGRYAALGSGIFTSPADLAKQSEIVVLSIKPQIFSAVLPVLRDAVTENTIIISIAAGISTTYIKSALGFDAKVIRVMPNTCLMSGAGATALAWEAPVTESDFCKARQLFDCAGITAVIPGDKMNEIVPINGSSPAYIIRFARIFCQEAQKVGLSFEIANALFAQTLIGTAHMMLHGGKSHQELIDMVTSPGGTTFAGLQALDEKAFDDALRACFTATVQRAIQLGKS